MKSKWWKFFRRLIAAAAITFFIAVMPLPVWTPNWFLYWQVPTAVFVFICYIGILLIDTILFPPRQ